MAKVLERRRRQRITVSLPIKIKYNKGKIETYTQNISVLGTYVEVNKNIPVGVDLDIELKIPGIGQARAKTISCAGIAFRSQPTPAILPKKQYGIGIFFRAFSKRGEKYLANYINRVLLQEKKMGKIFIRKQKQKLKKGGGKR